MVQMDKRENRIILEMQSSMFYEALMILDEHDPTIYMLCIEKQKIDVTISIR